MNHPRKPFYMTHQEMHPTPKNGALLRMESPSVFVHSIEHDLIFIASGIFLVLRINGCRVQWKTIELTYKITIIPSIIDEKLMLTTCQSFGRGEV